MNMLHSNRQVFFKDIMLSKRDAEDALKNYKSDYIDLSKFNHKLYEDSVYSKKLPISRVIYANFKGDWVVSSNVDDYDMNVLKFTDNKSGQYFEIAFPDAVDMAKFASEIYSTTALKQENSGLNIQKLTEEKVLYPDKNVNVKTAVKSGLVFLGIASLIYSFRNKKKGK